MNKSTAGDWFIKKQKPIDSGDWWEQSLHEWGSWRDERESSWSKPDAPFIYKFDGTEPFANNYTWTGIDRLDLTGDQHNALYDFILKQPPLANELDLCRKLAYKFDFFDSVHGASRYLGHIIYSKDDDDTKLLPNRYSLPYLKSLLLPDYQKKKKLSRTIKYVYKDEHSLLVYLANAENKHFQDTGEFLYGEYVFKKINDYTREHVEKELLPKAIRELFGT